MACAPRKLTSPMFVLVVLVLFDYGGAQERAVIISEGGSPAVIRNPEDMQRMRMEAMKRAAERAGRPPTPRPGGKPVEKPGEDKKKDDDKKDEKKDDEESKGPEPITRPPAADTPADPKELKVLPDKDGKVSLHLRGQKWVDVLQMLADWSDLAFDWTELPGDAVNLTTNKKYMLSEARDTFNRMLLDRGYTMLVQPELGTLSVHKVEALNPALVPRVAPEQLDRRDPYELAKVSFRLGDWITAEEAVADFEHMKSANGTLKPLNATNRIEVVDAVINLRQIRDVLNDEVSASGVKQRIRVFPLRHRNAPDVEELLRGLLGMDANGQRQSNSVNPRMMEEMQKRMQQMMQQQQQKKGGGPAVKPKAEIRLVVNRRENTIIAHAPPEQMAIIEQAIEAIDVPTGTGRTSPNNLLRWQSYKLASMDPEPLVEILEEIGGFDYNTQIKVDERNNAIVAFATLADHVSIRTLVDKLDGSGRRFYVLKLRRLRADYVAGTIAAMMGTGEDESSSRRYSPWDYYGRGRQEDKKNEFAVDADVENNWLLVRANDNEMEEIEDLLTQLGEVRVPGQNRDTVRYIQAAPGEQTDALLEKLQRIWPSVAPNELNVEPAPAKEEDEEAETPARETPNPLAPPKTSTTRLETPSPLHIAPRGNSHVYLAQLSASDASKTDAPSDADDAGEKAESNDGPPSPATLNNAENKLLEDFLRSQGRLPAKPSEAKGDAPSKPPAPVSITRGPDGRLIISSNDTRALDLLEDLIHEQAPRRNKYEIFKLQYADSLDVKYILEDFFEDDDDGNGNPFGYFFFDPFSRSRGDDPKKLSQRAPLKFIDDPATNSIVVQNADAGQLQTVKQLIDFYDQPDSPDSQTVRRMKFFPLRHASSETVVERVKEVFVDLLTPNDKARQKRPDERAERVYNYNFGEDATKKVPKYKGQLLITADAASNTVVVLAPGYVMEPVAAMIEHLDDAATPSSTVQVLKVDGLNAAHVQQAISKLLNGQAGTKQGEQGDKERDEGERDRENGPRERGERSRERR